MMRLFIVVEGPTEEGFVRHVLAPHLRARGVETTAVVVTTRRERHGQKHKGGGRFAHWLRDLGGLVHQHRGKDVRFTSMFDLYGLPSDFPQLDATASLVPAPARATALEAAMAAAVGDWRFIPYLQVHEFEALVLAALPVLRDLLDAGQRAGLAGLEQLVASTPPEEVNDGPQTAPSKRLLAAIPGYSKTLHGPLVCEGASLAVLRAACPRFSSWLASLEALVPADVKDNP